MLAAGLAAAILAVVPVVAAATGRPDNPGPPTDVAAADHAQDHAGAEGTEAPGAPEAPGETGTARAAAAHDAQVSAGHGRGAEVRTDPTAHAREVLAGLVASGKLPPQAATAITTVLDALAHAVQTHHTF